MATLMTHQLLLWRFIGLTSPALVIVAVIVMAIIVRRIGRGTEDETRVPFQWLIIAFGVALTLYVLGSEGRLFAAVQDWQVRDAVLHDMVKQPWPFSYELGAQQYVLRVPVGMYLIPAFFGKIFGLYGAHLTLLCQNAALLTLVLSIGSSLLRNGRDAFIALFVIVTFSGMDVLGRLIMKLSMFNYLDQWIDLVYSAHITQIFWVPQHAMAGWIGAALFLAWHKGRTPLTTFLAVIPLLAIWSPLSVIGLLPFAAFAGLKTLLQRGFVPDNFLVPALSSLLVLPSLLYLGADGDKVPWQINPVTFAEWALFILLEVSLYIVGVSRIVDRNSEYRQLFIFTSIYLLIIPLGKLGTGADFVMRASIGPLAILSFIAAEALLVRRTDERGKIGTVMIVTALVIGSVTPLEELRRAIITPVAPLNDCSYFGVVPDGSPTYVARTDHLPHWLRTVRAGVFRPSDPASCRERIAPWG